MIHESPEITGEMWPFGMRDRTLLDQGSHYLLLFSLKVWGQMLSQTNSSKSETTTAPPAPANGEYEWAEPKGSRPLEVIALSCLRGKATCVLDVILNISLSFRSLAFHMFAGRLLWKINLQMKSIFVLKIALLVAIHYADSRTGIFFSFEHGNLHGLW